MEHFYLAKWVQAARGNFLLVRVEHRFVHVMLTDQHFCALLYKIKL